MQAQNDESAKPGVVFRNRRRVLIVDDDADTVATLLAIMGAEGFETQGHACAQAGLGAFKSFDPDVIISDIAMPNMNGWALATQVREIMGPKRPVMIAITGQHVKSADKVFSRGFDFYFTKPADVARRLKVDEETLNAWLWGEKEMPNAKLGELADLIDGLGKRPR